MSEIRGSLAGNLDMYLFFKADDGEV